MTSDVGVLSTRLVFICFHGDFNFTHISITIDMCVCVWGGGGGNGGPVTINIPFWNSGSQN